MPRPVNNIQLTGTLTADPKMSVVDRGNKVLKIANYSIAFDWWNGHKLTPAWFFNCASFGYAAEATEKFLSKGKKILITDAFLQQDKYKDKNAVVRKDFKIIVNDFILVGNNNQTQGKDMDAIISEVSDDLEDIPI